MPDFFDKARQTAKKVFSFAKKLLPRRPLGRVGLVVFVVALVVVWIAGVLPAGAQDDTNFIVAGFRWVFTWGMMTAASLFIRFAVWGLKFVIEIAGYNGYLDSPAVTVGWVMVRDISNMFFVVILLLIAFGTILGIEQYEWKKLLVKFILAAVFINFSRVICGIMIDVAQVVMITFVNGIAATAGGNLVNMFNMDGVLSLASTNVNEQNGSELFMAAIGALGFSAMMMAIIFVYVGILLFRMVSLWVAIVLSPLAFILSVVPSTQSYASTWWKEFGNNVISGPLVVFFLWLAFVTVGTGQIHDNIVQHTQVPESAKISDTSMSGVENIGQQSAGITKAMSWAKMANFAIAMGILMIGAKTTQQLGVMGASAMGKAVDFGKKAMMIGSGLAAGMYLGKGAVKGTVSGLKKGGKAVGGFLVGDYVERVGLRFKRFAQGYEDWRAQGPRIKTKAKMESVKNEAGQFVDEAGNVVESEDKAAKRQAVDPDTGRPIFESVIGENGRPVYESDEEYQNRTSFMKGNFAGWYQKKAHERREKLLQSKKILRKIEAQTKVREDLTDARVTGDPKYFFQRFEGNQQNALDRIEQGELEAEKERSAAKTSEFKAIGRAAVLSNTRWKDGKRQEEKRGTVAQMITGHKERAARNEAQIKEMFARFKRDFVNDKKNKGIIEARLKAELSTKGLEFATKTGEGGIESEMKRSKDGKALLRYLNEWELRHKEDEADAKALEAREKEAFTSDETGPAKELIEKKALSEQELKAAETHIKALEGGYRRDFLEKEPAGQEVLRETKKWEARSKRGESLTKAVEEEAAQRFLEEDKEGQDWLKQQVEGELRAGRASSVIKEIDDGVRGGMFRDAAEQEKNALIKDREASMPITQKAKDLVDAADALDEEADQLEKQKKILEKALADAENDGERQEAQSRLNTFVNGDGGTIGTKRMTAKSKRIDADSADENDPVAKEQKARLKAEADDLRKKSIVYQYAKAKAKEGESGKALKVTQNTLMDKVENTVVHGQRGIQVPTKAITELIESYERDFSQMNYEMVVSNMQSSLAEMFRRGKSGEKTSESDKASMAGLFKHAFNNSWVDDIIIALMRDPQLQKDAQQSFGWKEGDMEFTPEKINQLQSLFVAGGDINFAKTHSQQGKVMDYITEELGLTVKQFFKEWEKGFASFDDNQLKNIAEGTGMSIDDIKGLGGKYGEFMAKQEENQAQLQLLGNLRDQSIANNHPENAGHSQYVELPDGRKMYVMVGSKQARDYVYSDVNKTDVRRRAAFHTHASENINEATGVSRKTRYDDFRMVRSGISTVNDYRGTNQRFENQTSGLSAMEDRTRFLAGKGVKDSSGKSIEGSFMVTGERADGSNSDMFADLVSAGIVDKTETAEMQKAQASCHVVNEKLAVQYKANPAEFLMRMAVMGNISQQEALQNGKMNITLRKKDGKMVKIDNIATFVSLYNSGEFNTGGGKNKFNLNSYQPGPTDKEEDDGK